MKRLIPLVVGLMLSGCSGHGAEGIAVVPPIDWTHLVRPSTPNTALAAPAGSTPEPDIVTRRYDAPPAVLYAAIRRVALAQPRTYPHAVYDDRLEAHFVARSRIMNFPDLIVVHIQPDGGVVLWSRSVYGSSDLGVNRARLIRWLAALDTELSAKT